MHILKWAQLVLQKWTNSAATTFSWYHLHHGAECDSMAASHVKFNWPVKLTLNASLHSNQEAMGL